MLLTASAALSAAGCGGAASRLESHMKRGQDYYRAGDYAHASIEFRNALQIDPKSESALLWQSEAAEQLGKVRDAAHGYQTILDQHPDNLVARARLGRIYALGGDSEQALKTIAPGLAKNPQEPSLLSVRALSKLQANDIAGATADADLALKLNPTDEDAIGLRAGIYERSGDSAAATKLLRDYLSRVPTSVDLRSVLLSQLLATGDRAGAEAQLRTLIEQRPAALRYRQQLARLLLEEGRKDDAQAALEKAVDVIHSDDARLMLVGFVTHQRSEQQGEQLIKKYIDADPANVQMRFGLAEMLVAAGKSDDALKVYAQIVSRDEKAPSAGAARVAMARIYLAQGRDADARSLTAAVLKANPVDTDALLIRGELALKSNQPAAAISDLRAVLHSQPRAVEVQELLARAFMANGEPALAEQSLRAALESDPRSARVRIELAEFLDKAQRPDEAIRLFEAAVRVDSDDATSRQALISAYLARRKFEQALEQANQLKVLRPNEAAGSYLAGMAYRGLGRPAEAQKEFERAHDLEPDAIEALSALAQAHMAAGRNQQAITLVRGVMDHQKAPNARTSNLLGELYLADHNIPAANAAFEEAARTAPRWWVPRRNLALAKLSAGDSQGALENLELAVKSFPAEPVLATDLARLYEKQQRIDASIGVYEELLKHNPGTETGANNLAMLLITYKTDRPSLDRARDLTAPFATSHNGGLVDTSGWVHFKRGEYPQALEILARAVNLAPETAEIRYHLAMAELKAGQDSRARSDLEAALSRGDQAGWSSEARAALASLRRGG